MSRRAGAWRWLGMLGILCVGVRRPAAGFEEPGHYYSINLLLRRSVPRLPTAQAGLIALCTQLPDESPEIDATRVFWAAFPGYPMSWDWMKWGMNPEPPSVEAKRLVAVQQLLHGLTGADAAAVLDVATEVVRQLAQAAAEAPEAEQTDALCALGFGLHLYGDAFAHRQLDPPRSGGVRMYKTGLGHAKDLHYPDFILYESPTPGERRRNWQGYVEGAPPLLGKTWDDGAAVDALVQGILGLTINPSLKAHFHDDGTSYQEREIIARLSQAAGASLGPPDAVETHLYTPCQEYLDGVVCRAHLAVAPPRCERVWDRLKRVAMAAFEEAGHAPARPEGYRPDYYEDPQFEVPPGHRESCAK